MSDSAHPAPICVFAALGIGVTLGLAASGLVRFIDDMLYIARAKLKNSKDD